MDYNDIYKVRRSGILDLNEEGLELVLTLGLTGNSLTRIKLLKLLYNGGQLTVTDMSNKTGLNKGAIYKHINKLEKQELLIRKERDNRKLVYYDIPDYMKIPEMRHVFNKCEEICKRYAPPSKLSVWDEEPSEKSLVKPPRRSISSVRKPRINSIKGYLNNNLNKNAFKIFNIMIDGKDYDAVELAEELGLNYATVNTQLKYLKKKKYVSVIDRKTSNKKINEALNIHKKNYWQISLKIMDSLYFYYRALEDIVSKE